MISLPLSLVIWVSFDVTYENNCCLLCASAALCLIFVDFENLKMMYGNDGWFPMHPTLNNWNNLKDKDLTRIGNVNLSVQLGGVLLKPHG